jgi:transposase
MQRMTDVPGTVHAGEPAWTVGIDLGRRAAHEAVLRAPDGTDRRLRFTHSRDGIDGFLGELAGLDGRVLVIIEPTATRWQALAEELSGEGVEVRQVHAATVAKLRGALDVTGAKSDRVDARTLASAAGYSHLVRPDAPAVACAHALCLERLRLRRERRRLRGAVKVCLDTIWPEFLQTFRGGERGVTARAVITVTGGDPARATRLGAIELERRVRAAAPGRHIGHTKIKALTEKRVSDLLCVGSGGFVGV